MKNNGFSLIELLVTLSVAGILLGVGIPSYQTFVKNSRISAALTELQAFVGLARSEAVSASQQVTLCASSDQSTCTGSWDQGWIIFTDLDGDRTVDSSDKDKLVKVYVGKKGGNKISLSGDNAGYIQFLSRGFTTASSATFTICDESKDLSMARGLIVSATGSSRRTIDSNSDGIYEDHDDNKLACI